MQKRKRNGKTHDNGTEEDVRSDRAGPRVFQRQEIVEGKLLRLSAGADFTGEPWVAEMVGELSFSRPLYVSASAWARHVELCPGASGQSREGRLWDVLWMLTFAWRLAPACPGLVMTSDSVEVLFRGAVGRARSRECRLMCLDGVIDDDRGNSIMVLLTREEAEQLDRRMTSPACPAS